MMNETTQTQPAAPAPATTGEDAPLASRTYGWRTVLVLGLVVIGMFLLGYIPATIRVSALEQARDAALIEIRRANLQLNLASAAIDARRGEYEAARIAAATFYTGLSAEVNAVGITSWSAEQREAMRPLLDQRDELITLLARGDPASAERLAELYHAFRQSTASDTTESVE